MKRRHVAVSIGAFCVAAALSLSCARTPPYDCIIINGAVVDGTGKPAFTADIGIAGDTVAKIGEIPEREAVTVIDAAGKVVAPGFIDIPTHTDMIEEFPTAHNYVRQGVTTVVSGNCGGSSMKLGEFFAALEEMGIGLNFASLVGQNSIRSEVMGAADRKPTPGELARMREMVADGMKAGAVGMSNGLKYRPAVFAETEEVIELARVAAQYGGFYATHMRSEGESVVEALKEAIEVGEKAGIPVEVSHLKVLSVERWGEGGRLLDLIDAARARGVDITADQYPYTASSTGLTVLFPPWALDGEGWREKAKDPALRKKMKEGIVETMLHERTGNDVNRVRIAKYPADTALEGKGLGDILVERGREPTVENAAELVMDLAGKGSASAVYHALSEEDVALIMRHPYVMHASDGHITEMDVGVPHPRCYGTFPRVLGVYVREKGILTLEEAVRKMTSLPASRIGIADRGILAEGFKADIVIFDPETVADTATFDDPHRYPAGIWHVFVNGVPVVRDGGITGELPGSVIYGSGASKKGR